MTESKAAGSVVQIVPKLDLARHLNRDFAHLSNPEDHLTVRPPGMGVGGESCARKGQSRRSRTAGGGSLR